MLKRNEAAHANSIEGFPLFVAGSKCRLLHGRLTHHTNSRLYVVLLAVHAGVPNETINTIGAWYTLSRVAFGLLYIVVESEGLSFLRSAAWWSGNLSCFTALVLAGKRL